MASYCWSAGSHLHGDADVVGRELERLSALGSLTAETVVAAAKPKRSPLHDLIYDGTTAEEALHAYRLGRAHYLLRSIVIVEGEAEMLEVRGFQVVTVDGAREYVPALEVRSSPEFSAEVRERMLQELATWRRRLDAWDEFAAVAAAIDAVLAA